MVENVGKPRERRIVMMLQALQGILRQVQRQGAVGPEEAEEQDFHPRRRAASFSARPWIVRGAKANDGACPGGPDPLAPARSRPGGGAAAQALQPAEGKEEIKGVWSVCDRRQQG